MHTDFQQFLNILYDWLNAEPRGIFSDGIRGHEGQHDPYHRFLNITLHAEGAPDDWSLKCHFVSPVDPDVDGYRVDFCVNLRETPEIFHWIDGEYFVRKPGLRHSR